ncbi:serine/threonine-protein kinase [candidate division CSSED10-310 bacterium]|uniref:Serine/threonine-protein kinase n=1 Tax=candidate division CSSED10-310 bacterium TaxID=2855610 RepID=A0ABV6YTX1_UNCC1
MITEIGTMNDTPQIDESGIGQPEKAIDRFVDIRLVGRGGMASVYSAYDRLLDSPVALKILHEHLNHPSILQRLRQEVAFSRKIAHPHILRLYDVIFIQKRLAITMELVKGGDLKQWILTQNDIDPKQVLSFLEQILQGLHAAHQQGILHRDLKPQNVMMNETADTVKLADFGLAYSLMDVTPAITVEGAVGGTPGYMAPEVFAGDFYDPRSDIYSFGVMAYELFTGQLPFKGANVMALCNQHQKQEPVAPSSINQKMGEQFDQLVLKCLAKVPEQRFQTMGDVLGAVSYLHSLINQKDGLVISHKQSPAVIRSDQQKLLSVSAVQKHRYTCPSCGEHLPPQLTGCPFCTATPLKSLGTGQNAVVLLPAKKSSPFRLLVRRSEFLGFLQHYEVDVQEKIVNMVMEASGTLALDRDECLERLAQMPCTILEGLDVQDAETFVAKLNEAGANTKITKNPRGIIRKLALFRHTGSILRGFLGLGAATAVAGFFTSFMFLIEKVMIGYDPHSTTAIIAGAMLIALGFSFMGGAVSLRAKDRPLSTVTHMLEGSAGRGSSPLSETTLAKAEEVLPKLKSTNIRRIMVSLMEAMARLRHHMGQEKAAESDKWLETALDLALVAQKTKEKRALVKKRQKLISRMKETDLDENATMSDHQSELADLAQRETHAFSRLLQLRARTETMNAHLNRERADRLQAAEDMEQALKELEIYAETTREMIDLFGEV